MNHNIESSILIFISTNKSLRKPRVGFIETQIDSPNMGADGMRIEIEEYRIHKNNFTPGVSVLGAWYTRIFATKKLAIPLLIVLVSGLVVVTPPFDHKVVSRCLYARTSGGNWNF